MEDRPRAPRRALHGRAVPDVAPDHLEALAGLRREGQVRARARGEVVEYPHTRAVGEEARHEVRADEPRAAGDEEELAHVADCSI